ncbi:MAG: hypothetical protein RBU37_16345 [Myxococcota bacterium]|jgi:hypothetical protein|nr:hypothetical protein [Myxococcota bacterium]
MPEEKKLGYKRVHFFKMFLTEDDWNHRHRFHVQKQELHTVSVHGIGIARQFLGELLVHQRPTPDLSIVVESGHATDAEGHDIVLNEPLTLRVEREQFPLPCTLYVVARYAEEATDWVRFKDGTRRNKYFQESAVVELVARPPESNEVELARIATSADVYRITDARDRFAPKVNEIDLRYRRYSLVLRRLPRDLKLTMLKALGERKHHFLRLGGHRLLRPAAVMAHPISVLEMLTEADLLTENNVGEVLALLNQLDGALLDFIKDNIDDPWVLERPEMQAARNNQALIASLLAGPEQYRMSNIEQVLNLFAKAGDFFPGMTALYGNESLVYYEGQEVVLPKLYPLGDDWERIKLWSAEFPEILFVDGMEWKLVGSLDITNEASEKRYKFRIDNAIDTWRTRQKLSYPDGTTVEDTGVAHEGGYASFELRGLIPDTHLAVIRMMDYVRADYELEFVVNDQYVGVSQCLGNDRQFRWRNWPFVIPAWFVNDDTVRIKQLMTTAERDVNMFRFWFYQPLSF